MYSMFRLAIFSDDTSILVFHDDFDVLSMGVGAQYDEEGEGL